jgi:APA family basic amino acid/polyamine antiporter
MLRKQLLAKKSLEVLLQEMAGEHRLRRVLGPVALSSLGIGAIIGTGIFVLTGVAARQYAGPGLILSFVIAGLACAFAALCYAEFASMAPIAGSAYTYACLSLDELATPTTTPTTRCGGTMACSTSSSVTAMWRRWGKPS